MIKKIKVSAFKSLVDFQIELGKFNCIIGLNGAGKSSVLQLISYISSIFRGDVDQWLAQRQWQANEVTSKYLPNRKTIDIEIELEFSGKIYQWEGRFNWEKGICTTEKLINTSENIVLYNVYNDHIKMSNGFDQDIYFEYSGSVLSAMANKITFFDVHRVWSYICEIENHELLSPNLMRAGSYNSQVQVGSVGKHLINHIHNLSSSEKDLVRERLAEYFPQVIKIATKSNIDGALALLITERFYEDSQDDSDQIQDNHIDVVTDARHINDGMLRILNLLVSQRGESKFQLFDEIENGVNPEITEKLMDGFVRAPQQTLVTTHSPMILNYLDEDVAIKSVIFVYKRDDGKTRAKHLFEIPSAKEKLEDLAPGEVMVDLYLEKVAKEVEQLERREASE